MSIDAINWALEQPGTPTQKHVLLVLANHANDEGHAFPSTERICHTTGLSNRAVRQAKYDLVAAGLIVKSNKFTRSGVRLVIEASSPKAARHAAKVAPAATYAENPATCQKVAAPAKKVAPAAKKVAAPAALYNHHITTNNHTPSVSPSAAKKSKRGSRLPNDWQPTEPLVAYAAERGLNPERQAEDFRDYWHAATGRNAVKHDWAAAFRTWCRRAQDYQRERQQRLDHRNDSKIIPLRRLSPAEQGRQASIDRLEKKYGR